MTVSAAGAKGVEMTKENYLEGFEDGWAAHHAERDMAKLGAEAWEVSDAKQRADEIERNLSLLRELKPGDVVRLPSGKTFFVRSACYADVLGAWDVFSGVYIVPREVFEAAIRGGAVIQRSEEGQGL